jgi:GDPmannose 4,6-dehydratase
VDLYGVTHKPIPPKDELLRLGLESVTIRSADLAHPQMCQQTLNSIRPDVIFHLAAVHGSSQKMHRFPVEAERDMYRCHVEITQNLVDWIRENNTSKLILAGSSQMYLGLPTGVYVDEMTTPSPINYYGETKLKAWDLIKKAREYEPLHLSCAILFNHSSEFSKPEFLLPQIVDQVRRVILGETSTINIGMPNAYVDISSATDVARALILMSKQSEGNDYVIGSGNSRTIASIIASFCDAIELDPIPRISATKSLDFVSCIVSNSSKAKSVLGWETLDEPETILESIYYSRF